jgi:hypothetical protein
MENPLGHSPEFIYVSTRIYGSVDMARAGKICSATLELSDDMVRA